MDTETRAALGALEVLPGEDWRPVVGYEGRYLVSSLGRVWSQARRHRRVGMLLKPVNGGQGYLVVNLRDGRDNARVHGVHLLLAAAFIGPRPEGQVTRHLNGVATDNRLDNLAYGTYGDNAHDAVRHGTHSQGSKTHCPQGHPYEGENLRQAGPNHRRCAECCRAQGRARWARRRAEQQESAA